jgi:heme-binding NEAT domain protein
MMTDQNDAPGASQLLYGSVHNVTSQQQRGLVASSNEQPIVPRIHSSSSRAPHSQDPSPTPYETSSVNDFSSVVASSSSTFTEETEAPDPAIVDALRNAKERLFVLKLGEDMENLIDQRRQVC